MTEKYIPYSVDGRSYKIPESKSAEFEKTYPSATIRMNVEDRTYNIPLEQKNEFMKTYSNATYAIDEPSDSNAEEISAPVSVDDEQESTSKERRQDEDKTSFWETLGKSTGAAGTRFAKQALDLGRMAWNKSVLGGAINLITGESYDEKLQDEDNLVTQWSTKLGETADRLSLEADPTGGKEGYLDLIKQGRLGTVLQKAVGSGIESLPMMLAASNPYTAIAYGAAMAESEYADESRENPEVAAWKRRINATGQAALELAIERLGGPFKAKGKLTKEALEKFLGEAAKEGAETIAKRIFKGLGGVLKEGGEEGLEELGTSFGNDILGTALDAVDGNADYGIRAQWEQAKAENPDLTLAEFAGMKGEEYIDSFIGGAVSGMEISGTVGGARKGYSLIKGETRNAVQAARDNGANLDYVDMYDTDALVAESATALEGALVDKDGNPIVDRAFIDNISADEAYALAGREDFSNEQRKAFFDYAVAKAQSDGLNEKLDNRLNEQIEGVRGRIDEAKDENGRVIVGTVDGKAVYVKGGYVTEKGTVATGIGDVDGYSYGPVIVIDSVTGEKTTVSSDKIQSPSAHEAYELFSGMESVFREREANERDTARNTVSPRAKLNTVMGLQNRKMLVDLGNGLIEVEVMKVDPKTGEVMIKGKKGDLGGRAITKLGSDVFYDSLYRDENGEFAFVDEIDTPTEPEDVPTDIPVAPETTTEEGPAAETPAEVTETPDYRGETYTILQNGVPVEAEVVSQDEASDTVVYRIIGENGQPMLLSSTIGEFGSAIEAAANPAPVAPEVEAEPEAETAQETPADVEPEAPAAPIEPEAIDWDALFESDPEAYFAELQNQFGEEALDILNEEIEAAQNELDALGKAKTKTQNERLENRKRKAALQSKIEALNGMVSRLSQPTAPEAAPVAPEVPSAPETPSATTEGGFVFENGVAKNPLILEMPEAGEHSSKIFLAEKDGKWGYGVHAELDSGAYSSPSTIQEENLRYNSKEEAIAAALSYFDMYKNMKANSGKSTTAMDAFIQYVKDTYLKGSEPSAPEAVTPEPVVPVAPTTVEDPIKEAQKREKSLATQLKRIGIPHEQKQDMAFNAGKAVADMFATREEYEAYAENATDFGEYNADFEKGVDASFENRQQNTGDTPVNSAPLENEQESVDDRYPARKGDVDWETIVDTFGLRSYLIRPSWTKVHNAVYDVFMEMSKMLGISPKSIGQGGTLGFAEVTGRTLDEAQYGASADYVNNSLKGTIYLRDSALSGMIHEWWHSLDNALQRWDDVTTRGYASTVGSTRFKGRSEVHNAILGVLSAIRKSGHIARINSTNWRNKSYFKEKKEQTARAFEQYIMGKFAEKGIVIENVEMDNRSFQPTAEEMAVIAPAFDKLFEVLQEKEGKITGTSVLFQIGQEVDEKIEENNTSEVARKLANEAIDMMFEQAGREVVFVTDEQAEQMRRLAGADAEFMISSDKPVFVSNAAVAVMGIKQEKATPAQWLAMIEKAGGLKAGEDKWMGLSDWLKESDKKTLTKQEVLDYIVEHIIQIEEVHYAEAANRRGLIAQAEEQMLERFQHEFNEYVVESEETTGSLYMADHYQYAYNKMLDIYGDDFGLAFGHEDGMLEINDTDAASAVSGIPVHDIRVINRVRENYTTGGLENKREIAFVVPTVEAFNDDEIHFVDAGDGRAIVWVRFGDTYTNEEAKAAYEQARKEEEAFRVQMEQKYGSLADGMRSILTEEEFAHYMDLIKKEMESMSEMEKPKGKKVLVIDEIQSNRHQEGREKGYRQSEIQPLLDEQKRIQEEWVAHQNKLKEKFNAAKDKGEQYEFTKDDLETREALDAKLYDIETRIKEYEDKVPDAPFEKNWHELAMKRMLRYAAENGYDAVAWTKGEQQAERYGIAKVVKDIYVAPSDVERYVSIKTISGDAIEVPTEPNSDVIVSGDYKGQRLSDVVGKELADKILSVPEGTDDYISGDDLKVGGEGMKGFYDKMLPAFMNKYGKKWGIKVADITLPNVEEAGRVMHSVPVTDAMKESVMEGQVMFMKRPNGKVFGWTDGKKIYLTKDGLNPNTKIHEYTHLWAQAMMQKNPKGWQSVKDLLRGTPVWNEVLNDPNYSSIHADEDLVASEVLSRISGRDGSVKLERMAQQMVDEAKGSMRKLEARGLVQRIKDALNEFWNWVGTELFGIEKFESVEQVTDRVLWDLFNNTDLGIQDNGNGKIEFSISTWENGGRDYLANWLKNDQILEEDEKADILARMDEFYENAQKYTDVYVPFGAWSEAAVKFDKDGSPLMSVIKKNGDYAMNLDFSLVCKKRRPLNTLLRELIKRNAFGTYTLRERELAEINWILQDHGFEVACALCFVDSKRFRVTGVADVFATLYNNFVKALAPEGAQIAHFNYSNNPNVESVENGLDTMPDEQLNWEKFDKLAAKYGPKTVEGKVAAFLRDNPSQRKLVDATDFIDSKGFEAVKEGNPKLLSLYNSKKGTGGPKASFGDVQYLNDILKKDNAFDVEKAYEVGGVRLQSFSDFVPHMYFDYMQLFAELAAKKLPAHAYTKEALFAKIFGMSGIKINMSLVPSVVEGGIAPGLDANGNYTWSEAIKDKDGNIIQQGQSFPFDEAMTIQNAEGYSKNCGVIAVGISDAHIEKMLGDPNIPFIIPYHKSSLNAIVARMTNIDKYKDYTKSQNTTKADGTKIEGEDFNFNAYLHEHKDATPQQAAQAYLDWCKENNYRPKFSQFAYHQNYYKLLQDFNTVDATTGEYAPQGAVTMTFPTKDSAFGDVEILIQQGLAEDVAVEEKMESEMSKVADEVEARLKEIAKEPKVSKKKQASQMAKLADERQAKIKEKAEESDGLLFRSSDSPITPEMDAEYLAAVERGDMETAQRMVDEAADRYLNEMLLPNDSDEVGFKYHRGPAPAKTFKRYAVLNVTPEGFKAAYAGNKTGTPVGVWLDAQNLASYTSDMVQFDDGTFATYIAGDTGAATNTKFSPERAEELGVKGGQRWLLERGGKHSSDVPNFSQMNLKVNENGEKVSSVKDGALPHNKLIFEIEYGISEEGDLTDYVRENGRKMKGKNQGLAKIGPNQYYDFKTNPNAVGNWGIGGTFRITRLVPHSEIISVTEQYKKDAIAEADRLYESGEITKKDRDARVKSAESIQVQKWVGGYNPADFGLSEEIVKQMAEEGSKMKLTDAVTYDDAGNVIPLSERFNPEKDDIRYRKAEAQNAAVDYLAGEPRLRAIENAVNEEASKLGVKVTYKTRSEMPDGHQNDKGYYNPKTGEVVVCTENATSIADAIQTILHEAVAHKGLRQLMGDKFNEFINRVYDSLDAETKAKVDALAESQYNGNKAVAMEEYMATLAESTDFKKDTIWDKIKSIFEDIINFILGRNDIKIGDNELRYILRASYNNMVNPRGIDTMRGWARDLMMREEYGVGEVPAITNVSPLSRGKGYEYEIAKIKENAIKDGTFMKAPNGADTKLTEDQWLMVRTKNFIDWFGDWINDPANASKIVDENGEPMVMVHGSENKFTIFRRGKGPYGSSGRGMYFGRAPKDLASHTYGGESGYKYLVFLNVRNLFNAGQRNLDRSIITNDAGKLIPTEVMYEIIGTSSYEQFIESVTDVNGKRFEMYQDIIKDISKEKYQKIHDSFDGKGMFRSKQNIVRRIFRKNKSYLTLDHNYIGEIVVRDPNQIKSAEPVTYDDRGNEIPMSLRFSQSNDDIRFRTGVDPSTTAREAAKAVYDKVVNDTWQEMQRQFQDAYQPVRIAIDAIQQETGNIPIEDYENYLLIQNQSSSRSRVEIDEFAERYYSPIVEQVNKIIDTIMESRGWKVNDADRRAEVYGELRQYLIAKHGLERNEYYQTHKMRNLTAAEKRKEYALAKHAYDTEVADINADTSLTDAERELKLRDAKDAYDAAILEINTREVPDIRDYSGLTSLFGLEPKKFRQAEAEARTLVDNFENEFGAEADILWERINKATDKTLRHSYESGIISRQQYNDIKDMFEFYIPLRGFEDITAEDIYSYARFEGNRFSPAVQTAKGRTSVANDPLAYIMSMAESEITQGNKNRAKQALYNYLLNRTQTDADGNQIQNSLMQVESVWYVKSVDAFGNTVMTMAAPDHTSGETYEEFEARMEALAATGDASKSKKGKIDIGMRFQKPANMGAHYVHLKVNGVDKAIYINGDPKAADAINGTFKKDRNELSEAMGKWNRFLSSMFTNYSLEFTVRNYFRDMLYSHINIGVKESDPAYRKKFRQNWRHNNFGSMVRMLKAFRAGEFEGRALTEDEAAFVEFMKNGGQTGYVILNKVETHRADLEKAIERMRNGLAKGGVKDSTVFKYTLGGIELLNEASELVTRFAAFKTSRDMGRSVVQSISDAKEITVNFNTKGAQDGKGFMGMIAHYFGWSKYFFNASVQGIQNLKAMASANKLKFGGVVGGIVATGFLMPLITGAIAQLLGGDEEEYWNIPEYDRQNNFCIPVGNGKYAKIPLPIGFREMYALGDMVSAMMFDKKFTKDVKSVGTDMANKLATIILPINPLEGSANGLSIWHTLAYTAAPSSAQFLIQNLTNTDWKGAPLQKEYTYNENDPQWMKAFAGNPDWMKMLSKWCNEHINADGDYDGWDWSPEKLDNTLSNLFGGVYTLIKKTGTGITEIWNSVNETSVFDVIMPGMLGDDIIQNADKLPVTGVFLGSGIDSDDRFVTDAYYEMMDYYDSQIGYIKRKAERFGYDLDEVFNKEKGKHHPKMNEIYSNKNFDFMQEWYKGNEDLEKLNDKIKNLEKKIAGKENPTQSDLNKLARLKDQFAVERREFVDDMLELD